MQQDNIQRGQQPQAIYRRKINFFFHSGKCRKEEFNISAKAVKTMGSFLSQAANFPVAVFKKRLNIEPRFPCRKGFFSQDFFRKTAQVRKKGSPSTESLPFEAG